MKILNGARRDVLEHFDDGGGEAAAASMDVSRLGEYLLRMVGHAVVRGSAGQSTKSWCAAWANGVVSFKFAF